MKKMYLGLGRKIFLQIFTLLCVSLYQVQVWNCWWWDCRGLHEERSGLPHARHSQFLPVPSCYSQFQLAPPALPQGTAWPSSHVGGFLGQTCLRKGKMPHGGMKRKSVRISPVFVCSLSSPPPMSFSFIPFSPLVLLRGECRGKSGWVGLGTWYFCQG